MARPIAVKFVRSTNRRGHDVAKKPIIPESLKPWIEARRRFGLSHAHIQMARELGMNPKKLGKLVNHDQERWKAPLPDFIERIYLNGFGRTRPQTVRTIEEVAAARLAKGGRPSARPSHWRNRILGTARGDDDERPD
ncbi:MAG: hypothetical protein HQL40_08960 [Alphaproteobacteria bacterium]|nr:hypothetical protein [Alphaproteobacteria bacterium]